MKGRSRPLVNQARLIAEVMLERERQDERWMIWREQGPIRHLIQEEVDRSTAECHSDDPLVERQGYVRLAALAIGVLEALDLQAKIDEGRVKLIRDLQRPQEIGTPIDWDKVYDWETPDVAD